MASYVCTLQFTPKGFSEIKNTRERTQNFRNVAEKLNIQVTDIFWTQGEYDGILIFDAPDEVTATAATLELACEGYVRPSTHRAFRDTEMQSILEKF